MFRRSRRPETPKNKRLIKNLIVATSVLSASAQMPAQDVALYSIGDPTEEEQLFVELINRAREDAGAEALRLANTESFMLVPKDE